MKAPLFRRSRLQLGLMAGFAVFSQSALAICVASPGTVTCSGASASGTVLTNASSPPLASTVILDPTFQVNASAGAAFQISNTAGIPVNLEQQTGGFATSLFGFMIQTNGGVNQQLSGNITGTAQSGLATTVNAGGGDLVINQLQGTISGQTIGITTQNQGNGVQSVTTAGTVTSPGNGLGIVNGPSSTNLTIHQAAGQINAGGAGIAARNEGTGATVVTTEGQVNATANYGLTITNQAPATSLTITHTATGAINAAGGISASNTGSGDARIEVAGTVAAAFGAGVTVSNDPPPAPAPATPTDLTVAQTGGSISGASVGISTRNTTGGDTVIATATSVTSAGGNGINAAQENGGDLTIAHVGTIQGHVTGIGANNFGTGDILIDVNGDVSATGPAGDASGVGVFATSGLGAITDVGKVTVNQAPGTTITGTNWGVGLNQFGTDPIEFNVEGTIVGGVGGGIYTASPLAQQVPVILNMLSGADVSATGADNIAIRDGGGRAQLTLEGGSAVTGHVRLGSNSDTMLVKTGAVISTDTVIDGGSSFAGVDLITDPGNPNTNKLTFENTEVTRPGVTLLNWQTILLDNTPTELTDSTLHVGKGTNPDGSLQGLVLRNGTQLTLNPVVQFIGDVSVASGTVFHHWNGGEVDGTMTNGGTVRYEHPSGGFSYTNLSVSSYAGVDPVGGGNTGVLVMNTHLGPDGSDSDVLTIDGGTGTGFTTLQISNTDGLGALTTGNGILVVWARNGATTVPGAFALAERLFAGGYEYLLYRGGIHGDDPESWYLRTVAVPTAGAPAPIPTLGEWSLLGLSSILAMLGFARIRRRRA